MVSRRPGGGALNPEPVRPFTLDPGQEAGARHRLLTEVPKADDPCAAEPGSAALRSFEPVTFEVLGFPGFRRFQAVDTRTEIRLVGHGPGC